MRHDRDERTSLKIVIVGGTGFIGRTLALSLAQAGHHVTVLSRNPGRAADRLGFSVLTAGWNGRASGPWTHVLDGADAVINLAGAPIAERRWTKARRQLLWDSRVGTTATLVQALSGTAARPSVLLNASGVGFYGAGAIALTEEAQAGTGFLAELSQAWEQEAVKAEALGLRVVRLRVGMVLGTDGGALPRMLPPFRFFLGGPIMPGNQWVSWIHRRDLIGLIDWALHDQRMAGPINAVAPTPVTMKAFCKTLGLVLGRPSWLPVSSFALRLALGELATLLTTGQYVAPAAALRSGYRFTFPSLRRALDDLLRPSPRPGATPLHGV